MSGLLSRSITCRQWAASNRPPAGDFVHPPLGGQAYAVLDQRLLGVGVDPRVDRLVAHHGPGRGENYS